MTSSNIIVINDLGRRDLADRRRDIWQTLFNKILNHEVNVVILAKGGIGKYQAHNKFMHIGSHIDNYNCFLTPNHHRME